jgi:hypothetical protein
MKLIELLRWIEIFILILRILQKWLNDVSYQIKLIFIYYRTDFEDTKIKGICQWRIQFNKNQKSFIIKFLILNNFYLEIWQNINNIDYSQSTKVILEIDTYTNNS